MEADFFDELWKTLVWSARLLFGTLKLMVRFNQFRAARRESPYERLAREQAKADAFDTVSTDVQPKRIARLVEWDASEDAGKGRMP